MEMRVVENIYKKKEKIKRKGNLNCFTVYILVTVEYNIWHYNSFKN